jgi:hypothetical protein
MRTVVPWLVAGMLVLPALALAQTGGGGGASGGGTGGAAGGTTTGTSPGGSLAPASPSGSSSGGSGGNLSSPAPRSTLSPPNENPVSNPGGALSTTTVGSGGAAPSGTRNCETANCESPLRGRYMREVDAMVRLTCPQCLTRQAR